jgi:putative endonuclease
LSHSTDDGIVVGMPWVYILRCRDHSLYVGWTADLEARVERHRAGEGGAYTSKRLPVTLVYSEHLVTQNAAVARETQLKRWSAQKKKALIAGDEQRLRRLSKRRQRIT